MQIGNDCASSALTSMNFDAKARVQAQKLAPQAVATAQEQKDTFTISGQVETEQAGRYSPAARDVQVTPATVEAEAPAKAEKAETKNTTALATSNVKSEPAAEGPVTAASLTPESPAFGPSDFNAFLKAFGSSTGGSNFNAESDFNGDGRVDSADLSVMLANFKAPRG